MWSARGESRVVGIASFSQIERTKVLLSEVLKIAQCENGLSQDVRLGDGVEEVQMGGKE